MLALKMPANEVVGRIVAADLRPPACALLKPLRNRQPYLRFADDETKWVCPGVWLSLPNPSHYIRARYRSMTARSIRSLSNCTSAPKTVVALCCCWREPSVFSWLQGPLQISDPNRARDNDRGWERPTTPQAQSVPSSQARALVPATAGLANGAGPCARRSQS